VPKVLRFLSRDWLIRCTPTYHMLGLTCRALQIGQKLAQTLGEAASNNRAAYYCIDSGNSSATRQAVAQKQGPSVIWGTMGRHKRGVPCTASPK